jgi:hypothetical protein
MRKQQENRMVLPLNTSSMHASAFLMPERPIAELKPFGLNGIELRPKARKGLGAETLARPRTNKPRLVAIFTNAAFAWWLW